MSFPLLIRSLALVAAASLGVLLAASAVGDTAPRRAQQPGAAAPRPQHPVTIRRPPAAPRVRVPDGAGGQVEVACATCHATRTPAPETRTSADLDEFHVGLQVAHGDNSCLSCHNPDDYDALRLANGTSIGFADVGKLCAQCHGTQQTSYDHGAHGGMTGYWDLTRGPRVRNHCVHCHDPHAPAFPAMLPTFKPRDRFLIPPHQHDDARDDTSRKDTHR